eukprot:ANDGO_03581.mRNA.1 hypothetical protein Pmar_PMAR025770
MSLQDESSLRVVFERQFREANEFDTVHRPQASSSKTAFHRSRQTNPDDPGITTCDYHVSPVAKEESNAAADFFRYAQLMEKWKSKRWSESSMKSQMQQEVDRYVDDLIKKHSRKIAGAVEALSEHAWFIKSHPGSPSEKVTLFPQAVRLYQRLGALCSTQALWDRAVHYQSIAVDAVVEFERAGVMYTKRDGIKQWDLLRDQVRRSFSLSPAGALKYFENKATALYVAWALRDPSSKKEDDLEIILAKRIRNDIVNLREKKFEKWGNLFFVYLIFFMCMFLAARCYQASSCDAPAQIVYIDSATFSTIPHAFERISIYPSCASTCGFPWYNLRPECTCDPSDLDCSGNANPDVPDVGSTCFCRNVVCDSCNICGRFRLILRKYIFWVFFFATILDSILFLLSIIAVTYPNPPLEGVEELDTQFYANRSEALRDCALIIPHYGPEGPIEATLKCALQIFPPDKIYVCHNGPSNAPFDRSGMLLNTFDCVKRVSEWYREQTGRPNAPDINYTWTSEGSKSGAIFEGVLFASREKYVCIMDNDCLLPKDLAIPTYLMERKDKVKALSFVIRAANTYKSDGSINFWPALQDLEYKKAALAKLFQSQMGTCLFAHGAIACWHRETVVQVMLRHNGNFFGDDLQMGLILQKFNESSRMKAVGNVNVPTITPSHFFCCPWNTPKAKASGKSWFNRMLCAPYRCNAWGCHHEEKSLFCQRARSWDVACSRMLMEELKVLLWTWNRPTLVLKPYVVYETYCTIQDFLRVPLLVYVFLSWDRLYPWLMLTGLFFALSIFLHLVLDYWSFRKRPELRSGTRISVLYLFYNNVLLLTRWLGLVYNVFLFLPRSRVQSKMKNRPQLPGFIDGKFVSSDNSNPRPPVNSELEKLHDDVRINPFVRGAKRTKENDGWLVIQWDGSTWTTVDKILDKSPLNTTPRREKQDDMEAQSYIFFLVLVTGAFFLGYYATQTILPFAIVLSIFCVLLYNVHVAYNL